MNFDEQRIEDRMAGDPRPEGRMTAAQQAAWLERNRADAVVICQSCPGCTTPSCGHHWACGCLLDRSVAR